MASKGLGSGVLFAGVVLMAGALSGCGGGDTSDPTATAGTGMVRGPRPDTASPSRGTITRGNPGSTDPTIQGVAAASVAVGQNYSFQPTASDSANEMLTFNISNKPSWLSFNASTGLLSGTPTASNVGTFANIEISVTDGSTVASLPAFSIIVAPPGATGSVTLSWDAPTENSNGTPLVNLDGYKVYYGQQPGALTSVAEVSSAGVTSYVVQNLSPGTYYFAVASYNAMGVESSLSPEVTTTVD